MSRIFGYLLALGGCGMIGIGFFGLYVMYSQRTYEYTDYSSSVQMIASGFIMAGVAWLLMIA